MELQKRDIPVDRLTPKEKQEAQTRTDLREAIEGASRFMTGPQIESFVRSVNNEIERDKR